MHAFREMMIERLGGQSIQPDPHDLKNWLSQNAAGFVCKESPLGQNRQRERGEGRERRGGGRWHHQKELARAQYLESAIHSLCTEHSREKNRSRRDKVALIICWSMWTGWTDLAGNVKNQPSKYITYVIKTYLSPFLKDPEKEVGVHARHETEKLLIIID